KLIQPIVEGQADVVFGSRFTGDNQRVLYFWHSVGNKLLTLFSNAMTNLNLTDMETCYKAVRGDIHKNLRLRSERFGIEPEITTRLAQWGARIYEVPISYHGRSYAEGKSIGWRDGVQAIWLLVKLRFLDTRFTVHDGYRTLRALRRARGYHRWLLEGFQPYLGRRVLEAGCGIGSLTEQLLDAELLVCADADPFYTELIARRFGHLANLQVVMMDLAEPAAYAKLEGLGFDTVVCVNVLEHIDRANWALSGFREVLRPGGHAIVLVPAHRWLYSEADRRLGHHRRYSDREIREALAVAGFEVVAGYQFNRLGVLGWVVNRALGRTSVSSLQMLLFELLVPLARMIDRWGRGPGLSLVVVGRRPEES
ncbi:MAG: methyltransferase, partial [Acidimicrobiia bacterium]